MAFILSSYLKTHLKDENGNRYSVPLDDENQILTNIKKFAKNRNRIVYVANNPDFFEDNEIRKDTVFEGFEKTGLSFKEKILLDGRNKKEAKEIISGADIVILSGGKCLCQNNFFKEIGLKEILTDYKGLAIGISAGTMNLCSSIFNFPEEFVDLDEPRWLEGMGFCNHVIIPHFDGESCSYQIPCEEVDVVKDYVLPFSNECDFIGIPNGSYILIDNDKNIECFGKIYKISKGKVERIKTL